MRVALITPTVEIIGDEALTNSIIDRSITELQDSTCVILGSGALYGSAQLKKVVFTSVTTVGDSAFAMCDALETVDLHKATSFRKGAFYKTTAVKALILRADTVCALVGSASNSAFNKSTFFIYVPAALVDDYKANSAWSSYTSKIRAIEDWPEVCDPYSWEAVAAAISANTYKDIYKIGDMIPVDLGSEGVINMQIAAFDADTLADGSGTAAISWVAKELLATKAKHHNSGTSYEGWNGCGLRTYLQSTIMPLIPANVVSLIQSVTKTQKFRNLSNNITTQTTSDSVWVPGLKDLTEKPKIYSELFSDNASRKKALVGATEVTAWWLRDTFSGSSAYYVDADGATSSSSGSLSNSYGVCLGFCTGKTPT